MRSDLSRLVALRSDLVGPAALVLALATLPGSAAAEVAARSGEGVRIEQRAAASDRGTVAKQAVFAGRKLGKRAARRWHRETRSPLVGIFEAGPDARTRYTPEGAGSHKEPVQRQREQASRAGTRSRGAEAQVGRATGARVEVASVDRGTSSGGTPGRGLEPADSTGGGASDSGGVRRQADRLASNSFLMTQPLTAQGHEPQVIVNIRGFVGSPTDPDGLGRHWKWRQEPGVAIPWFENTVSGFADVGVRRIVFANPAGKVDRMPPDPLRHLSRAKRDGLSAALDRLRARYPGLEIGLYCGSGIDRDPTTIAIKDEMIEPDFYNEEHREKMLAAFELVPQVGFDFVVIDAISGRGGGRTPVPWLRFLEQNLGIPTYGEAFPIMEDPSFPPGPGRRRIGPDRGRIDSWRWFALRRFVESRGITATQGMEHYIGLSGHDDDWTNGTADDRKAIIDRCIADGFVPYLYLQDSDETDLAEYAVTRLAQARSSAPGGSGGDGGDLGGEVVQRDSPTLSAAGERLGAGDDGR